MNVVINNKRRNMNREYLLGVALAVALSAPLAVCGGPVLEDTDQPSATGPFLRIDAGGNLTEDTSVKRFLGVAPVAGEMTFDPGARIGASAGYNFAPWVGAGLEIGYSFNEIKSISGVTGLSGDAAIGQVPIMGNVTFQLPNKTRFVPFIGGGIGASMNIFYADEMRYRFDAPGAPGGSGTVFLDGAWATTTFAYQGFAGVRYDFNDAMGLGLLYRYLGTTGSEWDVDRRSNFLNTPFTSDRIEIDDLHSHHLALVFFLKF